MSPVDKSLANGNARMTLRDMVRRRKEVFDPKQKASQFGADSKGRNYRTQVINAYLQKIAPLSLLSKFDSSHGYGGRALAFILEAGSDESATLLIQYFSGVRSEKIIQHVVEIVSLITQHALGRMNERIELMTLAKIVDLLTPSTTLLLALAQVVKADKTAMRQLSIPFAGGALRCDIDSQKHIIVRTYVSRPSPREIPVLNDFEVLLRSFTHDHVESFLWFPLLLDGLIESRSKKPRKVVNEVLHTAEFGSALNNILKKHDWLGDPYQKRRDPEGDIWALAGKQMQGNP